MVQAIRHSHRWFAGHENAPAGRGDSAPRWAAWLRRGSVLVIIVCLILLARLLPVERGVQTMLAGTQRLGALAPLVYGVVYVVAALLFVPGSALTLGAGAIFGLLWGTVIVSIASTTAAALAFLIARYAARSAVERQAGRYPLFGAIDRAIGQGGWKIVALLRLSPLVPFSAGNYLYGLTAIRFWPYVLASWPAMLPGTFLYVYLGYLGRLGLAANPSAGRGPWQSALPVAGLVATVVVTVYVTRLARRAIRDCADVQPDKPPSSPMALTNQAARRPWRTVAMAGAAIVMIGLVLLAYGCRQTLVKLFGPPPARLSEAYERNSGGPSVDHAAFDRLLREHVSSGGWVDYQGLRADSGQLDGYIASLATAPFSDLGRDEKLALLINGYNAFTLRLILDHYPVKSIRDIPADQRWNDKRWNLGGNVWRLDQIEHEQVRPKFKEPRIHFALVCAAIGCPPLRGEAYVASRIDEQLEDQARYVHTHDRWFRDELSNNVVHLTELYSWYGGDFEQVAGSVLNFAARYSPPLKAALEAGKPPRIEWIDYDWALNSKENQR